MAAYNEPMVVRPAVGRFTYLLQGREILAGDTLYVAVQHSMILPQALTINGTLNVDGVVMVVGDYQPLDSDLTAIAALATTPYGRGFLELTDPAAAQAYVGATGGGDGVLSWMNL